MYYLGYRRFRKKQNHDWLVFNETAYHRVKSFYDILRWFRQWGQILQKTTRVRKLKRQRRIDRCPRTSPCPAAVSCSDDPVLLPSQVKVHETEPCVKNDVKILISFKPFAY